MLTLNDTTELMKSPDYKKRFVAEYLQLKIRYIKLREMVVKYNARTLNFEPTCPIDIYDEQLYHMDEYMKILESRAELEGINLKMYMG